MLSLQRLLASKPGVTVANLLRGGTTHSRLGLSTSIIHQENVHRLFHKPIWQGGFLNWCSLLPSDSSLHQVYNKTEKQTHTYTHKYTKLCNQNCLPSVFSPNIPGNLATLPCVGTILNAVLGNINIYRMLFVSRWSLGSLTDAKSNKTEVEDDKNDRDLIVKSCKLSPTVVRESTGWR